MNVELSVEETHLIVQALGALRRERKSPAVKTLADIPYENSVLEMLISLQRRLVGIIIGADLMSIYPVALETDTRECKLLLDAMTKHYALLRRTPSNTWTEATYWEMEACEKLCKQLAKLMEYTPPGRPF